MKFDFVKHVSASWVALGHVPCRGKIRRFELRRIENARSGNAPQRETEFSEEEFPELR